MPHWFNPNTGEGSASGLVRQTAMAQALRGQTTAPQAVPQGASPGVSADGIGQLMGKLIKPRVADGGYSIGQGAAYAGTTSPEGVFTPNRRGM